MEPRRLGRSGLEVSPIALGTMMFGAWGNTDEAECRRMVDTALDAGITLLDTADIYDDGTSERILGAALHGKRDESCWPPRSATRWAATPTGAACPPVDHRRLRGLVAPAAGRPHRPVPDAPP